MVVEKECNYLYNHFSLILLVVEHSSQDLNVNSPFNVNRILVINFSNKFEESNIYN